MLMLALLCVLAAGHPIVQAHPLGNDSISHFNVMDVRADQFELDYLLDIAETPAEYLEDNEIDVNKDGKVTREEQELWLTAKAVEFTKSFEVRVDDTVLRLNLVAGEIDERTGRLNTPNKLIVPILGPLGMTYRIVIRYVAAYPEPLGPGEHSLFFEDKTLRSFQGLRRILLQPRSLCQIRFNKTDLISADQVQPLPAWIGERLTAKGVFLEDMESALLDWGVPTVLGERRWRLYDSKHQYALVEQDQQLDTYSLPYCEILKPHPPLLSPDNEIFRYDQYDPLGLPNVRRYTVRFIVFHAKPWTSMNIPIALARPPKLTVTSTSAPANFNATAPDVSLSPASQPAIAAPFQPYASTFLDSTYNSLQPAAYKQQAEKIVQLLKGRWGFTLFVLVTVTAFVWGAAHALMPGHAKTVVAAYLISQRGTYWHAVILAIIVTITHTALVIILGLVIYFYQHDNPRLGPMLQLWLGLAAGTMVAGMGILLVWRALTGRIAEHEHREPGQDQPSWFRRLFTHSHAHAPVRSGRGREMSDRDHARAHTSGQAHSHETAHVHEEPLPQAPERKEIARKEMTRKESYRHRSHQRRLTIRGLIVLGITGGIVPCPTATILLLLGIGANVVKGALYAIVVFSLGLALTLMLIGVAALTSRKYASRLMSRSGRDGELSTMGRRLLLQIVPALSGLAVVLLGIAITVHYACRINGVQMPPFGWVG